MRGATSVLDCTRYLSPGFNSRTPCGVRPYLPPTRKRRSRFQFTHPVRGATTHLVRGDPKTNVSIHAPRAGCDIGTSRRPRSTLVSIHAPRAGCDQKQHIVVQPYYGFNSRTPCGVRQQDEVNQPYQKQFQFTHPVRGATQQGYSRRSVACVSIHAPRAGCDGLLGALNSLSSCFNSRTPCGVRRTYRVIFELRISFNSRTPCGVRLIGIQDHYSQRCFNSRTPCGVRLYRGQ